MRRFWPILLFAALAFLAVLSVYLMHFCYPEGCTYSNQSEEWARFGEYVGGTLGALFGLLAFLGVLFTIREDRLKTNLEEIQRLTATTAETVDKILDEEPADSDAETQRRIRNVVTHLSVGSLVATLGNPEIWRDPLEDDLAKAEREQDRAVIIPTIRRQLSTVQIKLEGLVFCLQEYEKQGGSHTIIHFYLLRFSMVVLQLHVTELLISDAVRRYFKPLKFLDVVRRAAQADAETARTLNERPKEKQKAPPERDANPSQRT